MRKLLLTHDEAIFSKHARQARSKGISNERLIEILWNNNPYVYSSSSGTRTGRMSCKNPNMPATPTSETREVDFAEAEKRVLSRAMPKRRF